MSLSSQLNRGFFALPLLALLGLLALVAEPSAASGPASLPAAAAPAPAATLAIANLPCELAARRGPVLRLALAPADLGPGSLLRLPRGCRA